MCKTMRCGELHGRRERAASDDCAMMQCLNRSFSFFSLSLALSCASLSLFPPLFPRQFKLGRPNYSTIKDNATCQLGRVFCPRSFFPSTNWRLVGGLVGFLVRSFSRVRPQPPTLQLLRFICASRFLSLAVISLAGKAALLPHPLYPPPVGPG